MYELAVCAGIGGISLGLQRAGYRTICYIEKDAYRAEVLKSRIRDGLLDDAPIWDDIITFDGQPWCGLVDILSMGLPCQPFSLAGDMLGEQDERYLWPHALRLICQIRPRFILMENVPGILMAVDGQPAPLSRIFADLAALRYDAEWMCNTAAAFGLPHQRERVFIVASPCQGRWQRLLCLNLPDSLQAHYHRKGQASNPLDSVLALVPQVEQRMGEPSVFRSNDGLSNQLERLEAVGEAVVPQIAEYIGLRIASYEDTQVEVLA